MGSWERGQANGMADLEQPVESVTVRLEEGSRCVCEGCYGTVRYVGEVPPSKGEQHTLATVWAWDGYCQFWWAAKWVCSICCTSSPSSLSLCCTILSLDSDWKWNSDDSIIALSSSMYDSLASQTHMGRKVTM